VRNHAVFLEDYDIALAQEMVQGVDVWINTPQRPWEACGTSGMKILVNGGLNVSELDGWWAEAYSNDVGWALGDGQEHPEAGWNAVEAEQLYQLLEHEIVPMFYNRDTTGMPRDWITRIRASMSRLTPQYSTNRMVRDYVEAMYLPVAAAFQRRCAQQGQLGRELRNWEFELKHHWQKIHWGNLEIREVADGWSFEVQVYLGEVSADFVQVQLYADPVDAGESVRQVMECHANIPGALNGYLYYGMVSTQRPPTDFTPRIVAYHPEARIPTESNLIFWWQHSR
jgi:starch phosphorylase